MMSESKHNRRTQRTKRAIYTAFAELLSEKELHKITVQISDARLFTRIILIYTISMKKSRERP